MIPKTIHYVWLGNKAKPKKIQKCIASWHKFCPDYEIKEWNETNFDVNSHLFVKEAYEAHNYAFASDVIRLDVLLEYGGIYVDADVEFLKPIDDLLDDEAFIGFEDVVCTDRHCRTWGSCSNRTSFRRCEAWF